MGGHCVGYVSVDPQFFDVIGAPLIHGRALTTVDAEHSTRAVLVNEFFVDQVMGGRNPVGRRLRFVVRQIRTLAEAGWGARRIAAEIGVARNTVRRYLRGGEEAAVQIRPEARVLSEAQQARAVELWDVLRRAHELPQQLGPQ